MCNCRSDIETQIAERAVLAYNTPDISDHVAKMECIGIVFSNEGKSRISTHNEVKISFMKKGKTVNKKMIIAHTFCPFCGEKYEKEVSDGQ